MYARHKSGTGFKGGPSGQGHSALLPNLQKGFLNNKDVGLPDFFIDLFAGGYCRINMLFFGLKKKITIS